MSNSRKEFLFDIESVKQTKLQDLVDQVIEMITYFSNEQLDKMNFITEMELVDRRLGIDFDGESQ